MFKGSLVALITPFRDGAVDETAFQEHVAWQIGQGTHGLVPIGTNGAGDHWLADAPTARVYRLDHETAKLALAHYSISELVYVNIFCRGAFPYSEDRWDARVRAFRARARSKMR